ncbi:MAG: EAL domain-containing protein [Oscillospiraceae bacterium]|nr:EAL domain-containing protein [Oscillospiraceae bacterium]
MLLDNSVRMIRQMHRKILVEGVETRAQIELLRTLGVDYLQGYYFSKPIPEADFVALISGEDKEED